MRASLETKKTEMLVVWEWVASGTFAFDRFRVQINLIGISSFRYNRRYQIELHGSLHGNFIPYRMTNMHICARSVCWFSLSGYPLCLRLLFFW